MTQKMIEVNKLSWTLEPIATELPLDENNSITIHPGDDYPPGYTGSKFTIRRIQNKYQLSVKSYTGNYVDAKTLPKNLLSTIIRLKGNYSGSLRIRWNGDTILAPQNSGAEMYIGKMTYGDDAGKLFPGLDLDKEKHGRMAVYTGPQSGLDVGEKWSVPAFKSGDRPKLIRRVLRTKDRIKTITEHFKLTDFIVKQLNPAGKRLYVTNFGHIVTPVHNVELRANHIDLLQTIENFNSDGLYNASRFTYQKAERSFKESGTPWVMALIGHIDDFDGFGPQFDLSTIPDNRLNEDDDLEDM